MKAFLITAGAIFTLIVLAHAARMYAEPQLMHEPWFWLMTTAAAALAVWAWWLVSRLSGDRRRQG